MPLNNIQIDTKKWKWPLVIVAVTVCVMVLLKLTQPTPPKVESKEKAWLVETETVNPGAHHPHLQLLGTVRSPFNSMLSASIQADVQSVPVRAGQRVETGDILVELDKREIQAIVTQREADVIELSASIQAEQNRFKADQLALKEELRLEQVAKDAFARQQKLKSSNLVAQERLEQAESQVAQSALSVTARQQAIEDHPSRLQQLRARLSRAEAALGTAKLDLERASVRAPFDGIVTEVMVAPGERVQIGQSLVRMYDTSETEVQAQLPDKHLSKIRRALSEGIAIMGSAEVQGAPLRMKLDRLAGQSNTGAGGVDAYFKPTDPEASLVLNSTVRLDAELPALTNTFTLPISSVYGTNRIYRVEDSRIQAIEVDILGHQKDSEGHTRIIAALGELNPGDQIITTQLPNAISGLKVELGEDMENAGE